MSARERLAPRTLQRGSSLWNANLFARTESESSEDDLDAPGGAASEDTSASEDEVLVSVEGQDGGSDGSVDGEGGRETSIHVDPTGRRVSYSLCAVEGVKPAPTGSATSSKNSSPRTSFADASKRRRSFGELPSAAPARPAQPRKSTSLRNVMGEVWEAPVVGRRPSVRPSFSSRARFAAFGKRPDDARAAVFRTERSLASDGSLREACSVVRGASVAATCLRLLRRVS